MAQNKVNNDAQQTGNSYSHNSVVVTISTMVAVVVVTEGEEISQNVNCVKNMANTGML